MDVIFCSIVSQNVDHLWLNWFGCSFKIYILIVSKYLECGVWLVMGWSSISTIYLQAFFFSIQGVLDLKITLAGIPEPLKKFVISWEESKGINHLGNHLQVAGGRDGVGKGSDPEKKHPSGYMPLGYTVLGDVVGPSSQGQSQRSL